MSWQYPKLMRSLLTFSAFFLRREYSRAGFNWWVWRGRLAQPIQLSQGFMVIIMYAMDMLWEELWLYSWSQFSVPWQNLVWQNQLLTIIVQNNCSELDRLSLELRRAPALPFTYGQYVVKKIAEKLYNSVTVCFCALLKYVFHIGLKREPNMD